MKVLWITNIPLPEATAMLTGNKELKASGGWLVGAASALIKDENVSLCIASVSDKVRDLKILKGADITHYVIPLGRGNEIYNKDYEGYWKRINAEVCPDIVHIHGTEFTQGLAYVNACGSSNVVVSIQGMKSAYYYYYYYGLSVVEIIRNLTVRDLLRGSILRGKRNFMKSGKLELELISRVQHIIGRTSWDRARTWSINPNALYHFCNETLRSEFYKCERWKYSDCEKHSIFMSQAGYPIKGLHQLLRALVFIKRSYHDVKVRIAGADITNITGLRGFIHYTGYGKIIRKMILKYGLENNVEFTGPLDAEGMIKEYLRANVFVSPSSIENSPNSLGEAQILGTPCISSYVGGAMDMMSGNEENLYRFEEIEMLAYKICRIFQNREKQVDMSEVARKRHCAETNQRRLLDIYRCITANEFNH